MWSQLSLVKESKGRLGVLATHQALYRAMAEEGFDMINHISYLQKLQEELHLMDNKVTDEDFVMILITSLLESWDNYTSYLGSSGNKPTLSSYKLIEILMEEDRRCKGHNSDPAGNSLQARQNKGKGTGKSTGDPNVECYNCHKRGHMSKDFWAKGGGKEGQGPKGRKGPNRSNQAQEANSNLNKVSYCI
jgi:gag-polypeptide of LTR copia-type